MHQDDAEIAQQLAEIATAATLAMFADYGLPLARVPCDKANSEDILYCGAMGFVGAKVRGSVLLAASKQAVERSCPPEGVPRDWTGELTNQLMGRVKARLLARGVETMLATPLVLQGEHIAPVPRRTLHPCCFVANPGVVLVWVDVESDPGFVLGEESNTPTAEEGEALFF